MNRARSLAVLLLLLTVASSLVACGSGAGTDPASSEATTTQRGPVGEVPAGLERFYGQPLSWGGCADFAATPDDKSAFATPGLQCTYLEVPLSYADPNGRTIKLGLLRRPASDPSQRIGSLLINPGGPGASGMGTAASLAGRVAGNDLGRRFDLVGFDPRGIGASKPQIRCLTPAERDAERLMNLNVDTSPAGVQRTEDQERADDADCAGRTGADVLANVGTREGARDLDVMRSALGDPKLTYLGYSYGTRLGTTYAEFFPRNVRAMMLDGAIDPAQDPVSQLVDQGRGFQQAFDAFAAWCAGRPDCALGQHQDKDQSVAAFQALVRPLIAQGAPTPDGRKLSYTDATTGVIQALYQPDLWAPMNRGLQQLAQGNGDIIMRLADLYYGRSADGTYSTETDAFQAINCVDNPPLSDPNVARDADARYRAAAPFLDSGQPPSPARDMCTFWPVPHTGDPHAPQVPGLAPVVVISTTHDPATPYQAGVNLAHDLNARLLTFDGTQHTAFLQGNNCVDSAGITYLTTLQLPPDGIRCAATPPR
jgi:pimeloyl-ACP methyl ester carboxylesterase